VIIGASGAYVNTLFEKVSKWKKSLEREREREREREHLSILLVFGESGHF
jgi:hypothetical protein